MKQKTAVNYQAWAGSMIGFIRSKGLERELADWCGGWHCPIPNDLNPLCGWSSNGVNVWGTKASIDAVDQAFHSHGQIEDLRRNLRHWREECGKLHSSRDDRLLGKEDARIIACGLLPDGLDASKLSPKARDEIRAAITRLLSNSIRDSVGEVKQP